MPLGTKVEVVVGGVIYKGPVSVAGRSNVPLQGSRAHLPGVFVRDKLYQARKQTRGPAGVLLVEFAETRVYPSASKCVVRENPDVTVNSPTANRVKMQIIGRRCAVRLTKAPGNNSDKGGCGDGADYAGFGPHDCSLRRGVVPCATRASKQKAPSPVGSNTSATSGTAGRRVVVV